MILVISSDGDIHATVVLDALRAGGQEARLLDLREFPQSLRLTARFVAGETRLCLRWPDLTLPLDEVVSFWWRRPTPFGVPDSVTDPAHRAFVVSESATCLQGVWQASGARWVNDPFRDAAASHKPWQLHLAPRHGLEVPDTLLTNDPDDARRFWALHPDGVIYKPFLQTAHAWRETRRLRPEDELLADAIRLAPVQFQELVPAVADLRVTVVGDRLFAAASPTAGATYDVDVRFDTAARYEPHDLPDPVAASLRSFVRELGLEYAAIDLRLTPDGRYVFLEVNPAGQFLYIEQATGLPITEAMAEHLATAVAAPA